MLVLRYSCVATKQLEINKSLSYMKTFWKISFTRHELIPQYSNLVIDIVL